jgi:hypothetical protein
MESEKLYTLIPLEDFKAVLGVDDREDKLARFCLVTSTLTIEQYCKRRFLHKSYHERIEFANDEYLVLNEYPVRKVISVFALFHFEQPVIIEPDFYKIVPDETNREDIPYTIILSPAILRLRSLAAYRVIYRAGYSMSNEQLAVSNEEKRNAWDVPADLAAACLELAAWNMNRYRGRRIGMTGNIKGAGKEGEHFEMSMPENVRGLLEAYKRRVI